MKLLWKIGLLSIALIVCVSCTNEDDRFHLPTDENEEESIHFGQWVVEEVIAYALNHSLEEQEIEQFIGKKATYGKNSATFEYDQGECFEPTYYETEISAGDFRNLYRLPLDEMGVSANEVQFIEVISYREECWVYPADHLFIIDEQTLAFHKGGVFFRMVRD